MLQPALHFRLAVLVEQGGLALQLGEANIILLIVEGHFAKDVKLDLSEHKVGEARSAPHKASQQLRPLEIDEDAPLGSRLYGFAREANIVFEAALHDVAARLAVEGAGVGIHLLRYVSEFLVG